MGDKTLGGQSPPTSGTECLMSTEVFYGKEIRNLLHVSYSVSRKQNYILKLHLDTIPASTQCDVLNSRPLYQIICIAVSK